MAEAPPDPSPRGARTSPRAWLRAIHRDAGHLAVGLTVVYAASGLAVNHIADWDPSFQNYEVVRELGGAIDGDDAAIARTVAERLGVSGTPKDVYRAAPDSLEVVYERRTLHVNPLTGHVVDEGQKPRFLLRVANWLHLNRGKKAWRYVADAYAAGLLVLAATGMFMMAGRKGLLGRGGVLVVLGAAIPIAYVAWSGGP
jgi:hypothetical protein